MIFSSVDIKSSKQNFTFWMNYRVLYGEKSQNHWKTVTLGWHDWINSLFKVVAAALHGSIASEVGRPFSSLSLCIFIDAFQRSVEKAWGRCGGICRWAKKCRLSIPVIDHGELRWLQIGLQIDMLGHDWSWKPGSKKWIDWQDVFKISGMKTMLVYPFIIFLEAWNCLEYRSSHEMCTILKRTEDTLRTYFMHLWTKQIMS